MLGPHTLTHFPTPPPFLFPYPSRTRQHTYPLTPYFLPHPSPHFSTLHTSFLTSPTPQHTSLHLPPHPPYLFPQLISPLPTPQPNTFPHSHHALSHIFPHTLGYVAKLPCDDVTLIYLTVLWKNLIKFFAITGNLKSCFGVGNVNFRCMKVW